MDNYTWRQGSTLSGMYLEIRTGEIIGDEVTRCALKKRGSGGEPVGDELAELTIEYMPAVGKFKPYYSIGGSPDQSLALNVGNYLADVNITLASGKVISQRARVYLAATVTTE